MLAEHASDPPADPPDIDLLDDTTDEEAELSSPLTSTFEIEEEGCSDANGDANGDKKYADDPDAHDDGLDLLREERLPLRLKWHREGLIREYSKLRPVKTLLMYGA